MAKHTTIFFILLSSHFIVSSFLLPSASGKTTNLRIYLHDKFDRTPAYGDVFAFYAPLTAGPEPDSSPLGRGQGTIAFPNPDNLQDVFVSMAYILTDPLESTLITVGRINLLRRVRQFPIVGGTGVYNQARGIVNASTYSDDPPIKIFDLEIIQDSSPIIEI